MIDLLPCPFCGGEARLTVHEGYHRASCFACGNGTRAYADRHEAVRRWSRRQESGTFQNGNDHGTAEDSSGVGSVSDLEIVREDAAMSELPNNCKRLREQLKKSLEREETIEKELSEARAMLTHAAVFVASQQRCPEVKKCSGAEASCVSCWVGYWQRKVREA